MNKTDLEKLIGEAIEKWNVPGAAIGVWCNGELAKASAGFLNSAEKLPVQDNSLFQIGSITKVITATLVMMAVDKGLVELDKPAKDYISNFRIADKQASETITVRQLLNHTNGITGDLFSDCGMGRDRLERYLDICRALPLCHPVGDGFSYSNAAYNLAGLLIERVTGQPFSTVVQDWVFEPLGLKNSIVEPEDAVGRSTSAGHHPDPDNPDEMIPFKTAFHITPSTAPAGATVMMSVEDLVTFARMHLNGGKTDDGQQILSSKSVKEMQKWDTRVPVPPRDISNWGVGWFQLEAGDKELFGHDGGTIGQYSFLRIHKESGTIVALFTNGGDFSSLMSDVFAQTIEPLTGFEHSSPPSKIDPPKDIEKYVGRYQTIASDIEIYIEDGKLMRKAEMVVGEFVMPEPAQELHYAGDETFMAIPPSGGNPALTSFIDFDGRGRPRALFSALRTARRTS